ncbi:hypothetical protein [Flavobacterium sp.]|uniref:hypothetical protein n=1 Tax=Flavobacterium sp. TaxID=239 RepID=UPI003752C4BB
MKKTLLILLSFIACGVFAQVGIGTTSPTAQLDINGTFRVRSSALTNNITAAKDSILVVDNIGNVSRVSSKTVLESNLKTCVKGSFASSGDVTLTLLAGTSKIGFDFVEFDLNNEFNTVTSDFTAKQNGIYQVSVQIKATSAIAIATNFGVAILKNGTVINRTSFANVGVALVNVTPPIRTVSTLVSLNTGDTISFNVLSTLLSLNLLGTREDCNFTINQIR